MPVAMQYIYLMRDAVGVRYIGRTAGAAKERVAQHESGARTGRAGPVNDWLRSVGGKFIFGVVEEVHESFATERENFWIRHYRQAGEPILNILPLDTAMPETPCLLCVPDPALTLAERNRQQ